MNADLGTTITGIVAGIVTVLGAFHILVPDPVVKVVDALALAIIGYFTTKTSIKKT